MRPHETAVAHEAAFAPITPVLSPNSVGSLAVATVDSLPNTITDANRLGEFMAPEKALLFMEGFSGNTALEFVDTAFPADAAEQSTATWLGSVCRETHRMRNETVRAIRKHDDVIGNLQSPADYERSVKNYAFSVQAVADGSNRVVNGDLISERANRLRRTQIVTTHLVRIREAGLELATTDEVMESMTQERPAMAGSETEQKHFRETVDAVLARPDLDTETLMDDATGVLAEMHLQSARARAAVLELQVNMVARMITTKGTPEARHMVALHMRQFEQLSADNISPARSLAMYSSIIGSSRKLLEGVMTHIQNGGDVKAPNVRFAGLPSNVRTENTILDKSQVARATRDLRAYIRLGQTWESNIVEHKSFMTYLNHVEARKNLETAGQLTDEAELSSVEASPEVSDDNAETRERCEAIQVEQSALLQPFNPSNKQLRADGLIARDSVVDKLRGIKDSTGQLEPSMRTYAGLKALVTEYGDKAGEALETLLGSDASLRAEYAELINALNINARAKEPLARDIRPDMEWLAKHWQDVQTAIARTPLHEVADADLLAIGTLLGIESPVAEQITETVPEAEETDLWDEDELAELEREIAAEETVRAAEAAELAKLAEELAELEASERAERAAKDAAELAELEAELAELEAGPSDTPPTSEWTEGELAELKAIAEEERLAAELAANNPEPEISPEDQALLDDAHQLMTDIFNPDHDMSDDEIVERARNLGDRPGKTEAGELRPTVSKDIDPARARDFAELVRTYNVRPDVAKSKKLGKEGLYYLIHILGDDGNGVQEQITIAESLYGGNGTFVIRGGLIGRTNRQAVEAMLDDHRRTTLKRLYQGTGALVMHPHVPGRDHNAVVNATITQLAGIKPPVEIVPGTYIKKDAQAA